MMRGVLLPAPNKLPHELFLKLPMKTSLLTFHARIDRAACFRAGAAILAVVLAFWLAIFFNAKSRATPVQPLAATNPAITGITPLAVATLLANSVMRMTSAVTAAAIISG